MWADLAQLTFVASPRFVLERGTRQTQGAPGSADRGHASGAVVRPRDPSTGAAFAVSARTAFLIRRLRRPRVLKAVAPGPLRPEEAGSVVRLVLDGVLEIEIDGRFVSGPAAWDQLCDPPRRRIPANRSARLTLEALAYGERLLPMPVALLAYRLYRYNTIPASPRWRARFPSSSAVAGWLGLDEIERQPRFRTHHWIANARTGRSEPWFSWHRDPASQSQETGLPTYKLYVSPDPAGIRDVFQAAARLIIDSDAFAFKVGGDVFGVLRPDKLVAHFASHHSLMNTANALGSKLRGMRAQGVPFTAPLDANGLISLGVDPSSSAHGDGMEHESWRLGIAGRLAGSIAVAASGSSGALTPAQFALARLTIDGIDLLASSGSRAVRSFAKSFGTA